MRELRNKATVVTLIFVATTAAGSCFGQLTPGPGYGAGVRAPTYDPSTETTVKGTVEEVQLISGRRGGGGVHLKLRTETSTLYIYLGPGFFLRQQGFSFSKGDHVEVTGSRVVFEQGEALIARVIRKGDQTLTLRDEKGFPLWSRRGGSR